MQPANRILAIALLLTVPAIAAGQQWKPSGSQNVLPPSTTSAVPRFDAPRPPLMTPIPLPPPSPVKDEEPIRPAANITSSQDTLPETIPDTETSPKQAAALSDGTSAETEDQQPSDNAPADDIPNPEGTASFLPPLPISAPEDRGFPATSLIVDDSAGHGSKESRPNSGDGIPVVDLPPIVPPNLQRPDRELCAPPCGEIIDDWCGDGCGESVCSPQRRRFLEVDWLYLRPRIGGAQYGTRVIQGNGFSPGYPQDLDVDWRSGFRLGLREQLDGDGSEWMLNWTRFHSDGSEEIRRQGLSDVSYSTNFRPGFRARRGIAKFSDDTFHIAGRRWLRLASHSSVRLDGGVRFSRIRQQLSKIDSDPSESIFIGPFTQVDQSDTLTKFVGVGPSIGIGIEQRLRNRLSLNIGASGAMLLGSHQTTSVFTRNFPERIDRFIAESHGGRLIPVVDLTASLTKRWDTETGHMELTGGYQMTNWFNMNNTAEDFNALTLRSTDTTVDGLFVRFAMHVW